MSVFKDSKSMVVIAVVALSLCAGLWYKRLYPSGMFNTPSVPKSVVKKAKQPEQVTPPFLVEGGVAPVIANINWFDPQHPAAIALDYPNFLFDTQDGLQVWNLETLKMTPLVYPHEQARLLDFIHLSTHHSVSVFGTLFGVKSNASNITLYWVPEKKLNIQWVGRGEKIEKKQTDNRHKVEKQLDLPYGFFPDAAVNVEGGLLLCSSSSRQAILVGFTHEELKQLTPANAANLYESLQERGVVGQVEGVGDVPEPVVNNNGYKKPLWFDTGTCKWRARYLPAFLAEVINLNIQPDTRFNSSGISIIAASWIDPVSHETQTLKSPLKWDWNTNQWLQRKASDYSGLAPSHTTLPLMENWFYAASPQEGKFQFLWGGGDRWTNSKQDLPVSQDLKLLPIGNNGVLTLLIDADNPGRVVRLYPSDSYGKVVLENDIGHRFDPATVADSGSVARNQFRNSLGWFTSIQLNDGGALIVDGSSHTLMVSPEGNQVILEQDLPQPQYRTSGVQLSDGSVVVFGGFSPNCFVTDIKNCKQGVLAGSRWIKDEKRWQTLTSLSAPFEYGMPFDGGNSDIFTSYKRSDYVLKNGQELYYLSHSRLEDVWDEKPAPSHLYRWNSNSDAVRLSPTQHSRYAASLIELNDGRLAAIGGIAEKEPASPACRACAQKRNLEVQRLSRILAAQRGPDFNPEDCNYEESDDTCVDPEQSVPQCEACSSFEVSNHSTYARSSEIYDAKNNLWYYGPYSNYPGGRAVKMANGRIFKFGLNGYNATDADYVAEVADAGLKQWESTPPFPIHKPDVLVSQILAIGNQVLIILNKPSDRYIVWDDVTRTWQENPLPKHSDWGLNHVPDYVSAVNSQQLLLIFQDGYEYISWPIHD